MTKVLVAEDETRIREVLVDILTDNGYEVTEAINGHIALAKVQRDRPDIILLDAMMPVLDGFEVLKQLSGDPSTRSTPVIMVTAIGQESDVMRAKGAGAWGYIRKPWENGEVEAAVLGALEEIGEDGFSCR